MVLELLVNPVRLDQRTEKRTGKSRVREKMGAQVVEMIHAEGSSGARKLLAPGSGESTAGKDSGELRAAGSGGGESFREASDDSPKIITPRPRPLDNEHLV